MTKFLAVMKREYVQRVRSKFFVLMTILGPLMLIVFTIVPGLLFSYKAGGDTRLAVVNQSENLQVYSSISKALVTRRSDEYRMQISDSVNANRNDRIKQTGRSLAGSFLVENVELRGRAVEEIQRELNERIARDELDGYLVIPADILQNSQSVVDYFGRNAADVITKEQITERINRAVRKERLIANGVPEQQVEQVSRPVEVISYQINENGEVGRKDSGAGFAMVFVIAFLIYLTVLLYGQVILGAVVEEKETRIAEVLFSSVRSSTLMIGKLVGVSLVALTQVGIWAIAFALLSLYGISMLAAQGINLGSVQLPHLPGPFFVYFFMFFVLGYFIYASIYVLVGSMVTTTQEGGQLAMPIVFLLMAALYTAFPVMRSPDSSFAFWVSMFPFFSPITMVVRIVAHTPPFWQIALSLVIAVITGLMLLWLSSRIYRIGMLMYGKRASIPEVMRWIRQS